MLLCLSFCLSVAVVHQCYYTCSCFLALTFTSGTGVKQCGAVWLLYLWRTALLSVDVINWHHKITPIQHINRAVPLYTNTVR